MKVDYPYCTRRLAMRILDLAYDSDLPPEHVTRALLAAATAHGLLDRHTTPRRVAAELLRLMPDDDGP